MSDHQGSLHKMKILPKSSTIASRYKTLQKEHNGTSKKKLVVMVADELINCWTNQDIPTRRRQGVVTKINDLLLKKC